VPITLLPQTVTIIIETPIFGEWTATVLHDDREVSKETLPAHGGGDEDGLGGLHQGLRLALESFGYRMAVGNIGSTRIEYVFHTRGDPVPPPATKLVDLLTDEDREQLHNDLAEMARQRRRAEDEAGGISIP
jgi:hypothetical protein